MKRYTERPKTAYEHGWEIRDAYGYHPYDDPEWGRRFRTFLHGRAWMHAEGPVALFNQAVGWLRRNRVLLPGVSVLARQVSEVRRIAEKRLHATVARAAHRADPVLPADLVATLVTPEGGRYSELERLRRPPTRTTGTAFARSLERVDEIGAFQLGRLKLSQIPPNRLAALARYGLGPKAASLERAAEPKRTAMLAAVMRHLEAKAIDEALDLFSVLMATRLISTAKRATDKERLSTLPQLEKASRTLARAAKVLVEAHGADLDALLNLDGGVKPEMIATDNASYSDIVFGIFRILGYNFSPASRTWTTSGSGVRRCLAWRRGRTGYSMTATNPNARWLFPGRRAGQPMTPHTLELRLRHLGFPTQRGRTAAIRHLVLQAPAPVIARMLGYHDDTTAQLAAEAGGTWRHYAPGDHSR